MNIPGPSSASGSLTNLSEEKYDEITSLLQKIVAIKADKDISAPDRKRNRSGLDKGFDYLQHKLY